MQILDFKFMKELGKQSHFLLWHFIVLSDCIHLSHPLVSGRPEEASFPARLWQGAMVHITPLLLC